MYTARRIYFFAVDQIDLLDHAKTFFVTPMILMHKLAEMRIVRFRYYLVAPHDLSQVIMMLLSYYYYEELLGCFILVPCFSTKLE